MSRMAKALAAKPSAGSWLQTPRSDSGATPRMMEQRLESSWRLAALELHPTATERNGGRLDVSFQCWLYRSDWIVQFLGYSQVIDGRLRHKRTQSFWSTTSFTVRWDWEPGSKAVLTTDRRDSAHMVLKNSAVKSSLKHAERRSQRDKHLKSPMIETNKQQIIICLRHLKLFVSHSEKIHSMALWQHNAPENGLWGNTWADSCLSRLATLLLFDVLIGFTVKIKINQSPVISQSSHNLKIKDCFWDQ